MEKKLLVSVVAPVFNEEKVVGEFYKRATEAMRGLPADCDYELLFVDDGSRDASLKLLSSYQAADPRVRVVSFSRNFGHQLAITAGVDHAAGDAVVMIDCDLQDPPEVITEMVAKWREGYGVVYGVRRRREGESFFKLFTASLFYRTINKLSSVELPVDSGDFRLMDRKVVDVLKEIREENRYIRGLVTWIGFRQTSVLYNRDARFAGETKFSLKKMLKFAMDGITSFSEKPLMLSALLGVIITAVSFVLALYIVLSKFFFPGTLIQGWASMIVVIIFLGGVQLLSVGVIGQYIGRIYVEVKNRPLYIVAERYGFKSGDGRRTV